MAGNFVLKDESMNIYSAVDQDAEAVRQDHSNYPNFEYTHFVYKDHLAKLILW